MECAFPLNSLLKELKDQNNQSTFELRIVIWQGAALLNSF